MQLVLVRHGQSTWNLEHRLQGQTLGVPLTELGEPRLGKPPNASPPSFRPARQC